MAGGRQEKLRIESLRDLKNTLSAPAGTEFSLLVRAERKVEMDLDAKLIGELLRLLQKVVPDRDDDY